MAAPWANVYGAPRAIASALILAIRARYAEPGRGWLHQQLHLNRVLTRLRNETHLDR